jgi:hypothetical protein
MSNFCTYFDQHYLTRGLALYRSLARHCAPFQLWVLCLDQVTFDVLTALKLPGVVPIRLPDFEQGDGALLRAKENRTLVEYYFTCTPSLVLYVLRNWPEIDSIAYLDADLWFFADPSPLYEEVREHSIGIIPHRFPPQLQALVQHGIYNVGWLWFRRDEAGLACLQWWRKRCLEWCYDRVEDGRFADQKYLDDWPQRFPGVAVIQHKGANLAPWNLSNYRIRYDGSRVLVDGDELIFYHFHGLRQRRPWLYDTGLGSYKTTLTSVVRRHIYIPYIRELNRCSQSLTFVPAPAPLRRGVSRAGPSLWRSGIRAMKGLLHLCRGILYRQYILVTSSRDQTAEDLQEDRLQPLAERHRPVGSASSHPESAARR